MALDTKMSNTNNTVQTQTSNTLHNAIMEAGGKDRPPMLAPGGGPMCQETIGDTTAQTRFKSVSKHSNDSLLARGNTLQSDEDSMKLDELMAICTNLQNRVLDLKKTKTTQRNEIDSFKRRVKKLEKKNRSRTHKLKRLYKVGLSDVVESSSDEESLGEDACKQGRRIDAIDADEDITLVNDVDNEMSDVDDLEKRRNHFAAKRVEEKRNKPLIKAQHRKIMCTYLKNMKGYKFKDLKLKDFDRIQEMFDKAFRRINTFEDFRLELVEGEEKRARIELEQKITKKQKVKDDKEKAKLK
nr:hypothetical protein [Tanacetum cinerariifolium]